tara:strand:- start:35036 stop:37516 length:2481 start_codon:yes stop_codon:yes gene_type:complete
MDNFKLSRIASKFDRGYWQMFQYGYNDNGDFVTKVDKFKDYFYYSSENVSDLDDERSLEETTETQKSLFGEYTTKINYTSIKSKMKVDKMYPNKTYQSDVKPEFKFILDNGLSWSNKRHILYFDIETDVDLNNKSSNKPENALMPITSFQCYSSIKKKYFIFAWHPEHTKNFEQTKTIEKDNVVYFLSQTEEEMILGFLNLVRELKCDIITGWYSSGFDVPYIINRCKRLGLPYQMLSPIDDVYIKKKGEYWKIYIRGLDHLDMMDVLKDMGYNLPNWKLATASKEILGDASLEKITEVTWKDWMDNFKGFLEYGMRDVEILKEIDEKIQMFDLYITLQQIANLETMSLALFKSMIVDNYIIKEFHNKLIFPTRRTQARRGYAGAIVIDPTEPGNHKNVTLADYTSLYPTSIMAFNISPETYIASDMDCEASGLNLDEVVIELKKNNIKYVDTGESDTLFGGRYLFYAHEEKIGLLPYVLKKLFLERVKINENLKAGKYKGDLAIAMNKRQQAYKLVLNSAYGAMGFNFFRLCNYECADAITYFAREALKFSMDHFNNIGNKVLYGDTDSIFVKSQGKDSNQMQGLLDEFNNRLENDFVKKYNNGLSDEYQHMDLKFEYDFENIYFGESKKRYYGIIRNTGVKYIRGLNIIRKDTPEFLKSALNKMTELAVTGKIRYDHFKVLKDKISEIKDYKQLGIAKAFGKQFREYIKTMPQHVKASVWANDKLGTNITHTDNPYLFYIKSNCEDDLKPKDRAVAVCLNEEDLPLIDKRPDIFEIDYGVYFRKQVLEQFEELKLIDGVSEILEKLKPEPKNKKKVEKQLILFD